MKYTKCVMKILVVILSLAPALLAQDPGWPRQIVKSGGILVYDLPKVDGCYNGTDIKWRQAFQLTPTVGKQVFGADYQTGTSAPLW